MDESANVDIAEDNPATKKVKNREDPSEDTPETLSFKAAVLGSQSGGKGPLLSREPIKVSEGDVIHEVKNGIGSVKFLPPIQQQMKESMGFSVVVGPLGRTVTYAALMNRLTKLWHPKGEIIAADQVNGHYVVRLSHEEDYNNAILNGPWTIGTTYLRVYPWTPKFNAKTENLSAVATWIKIAELPL